jgi:gamma-carbonic anhydrase
MSTPCILPYRGIHPVIGTGAILADTAAVIGRVVAGDRLCLAPWTTLRADGHDIRIGSNCSFGARSTAHIVDDVKSIPTVIGNHVTIGSYALAHACTIGDDCVVGDLAVVMDEAEIGPGAVIGTGAFVSPQSKFAGGWLYEGTPAKPVRPLEQTELALLHQSLRNGTPNPLVSAPDLPPVHRPIFALKDALIPQISEQSYVAPTATLEGNVQLAPDGSIWFSTVVIANDGVISIGERSNVQDNSFLETDSRRGPITIANDVTIGHNVRMGPCVIEQDSLIGMGSILEDGTIVETGACVAARALCEPGTVVEAGCIWAGRPARKFRTLRPEELKAFRRGREIYVGYTHNYLVELAS